MKETEKLAVGALVSALVLAVPGFLFHVAPRFPGSLAGSLIGIAGAVLTSGIYTLGTTVSVWRDYYGDDVSRYAERESLLPLGDAAAKSQRMLRRAMEQRFRIVCLVSAHGRPQLRGGSQRIAEVVPMAIRSRSPSRPRRPPRSRSGR